MRIPLIILSFFLYLFALPQRNVLVYLKDKGPHAEALLHHPETFLSGAAIERRMLCNSFFDVSDVPVYNEYLDLLAKNKCKVSSSSKWLNAVLVTTSTENIFAILKLPFVLRIEIWDTYDRCKNNTTSVQSVYSYGNATTQINLINLDKLHDQGYTGNNILISVCDGGFNNVNTLNAYGYLRSRNRIKSTRDFVNEDGDIYGDDVHGEEVFSILASKVDNLIIGSAFDADFLLARTENVNSETHSEEYNWVRAAEWADSAGAKIIQTSLGYNNFDSGTNYAPTDMDGRTAIITQGAVAATRKGIIIVNSAGNEGDNVFRKITAPSDADSILCVGSVNSSKVRVANSGQGPTADGRIKPDVMALGGGTAYYNSLSSISYGTGTSFASPLIAGLCACLLQKNKYVTNIELINAVKRSADRFSNPDTLYGYGIPDAFIADTILENIAAGRGIFNRNQKEGSIIKNTIVCNEVELNIEINKMIEISIFNNSGALVLKDRIDTNKIDITNLSSGIYYLKLNSSYIGKIIKQ